jgi:poly(ADP-ribose) glycohydrolase ARH3
MSGTESAFKGCLAGLALGDALGAPFEGLGPPLSEGLYAFLKNLPPVLRYTDDTEMAIGVAESLARCGGFDAEHMALRFAENFNPRRGYGPGTIAVLGMIKRGVPWQDANRAVFPEGSFGNGAAMRAAPIGLFFAKDPEKLREVTFGASSTTHAHPLAKEGALLITHSVSAILGGKGNAEILDGLSNAVESDDYRERLRTIREFLGHPVSAETVIERLGHSVLAHESAPTALYAFMREGDDYLNTIKYCISLGGDTDTICAMAGALSGTKLGIEGIPAELVQRLEDKDKILRLAEELNRAVSSA